jgi:hypothetical protein
MKFVADFTGRINKDLLNKLNSLDETVRRNNEMFWMPTNAPHGLDQDQLDFFKSVLNALDDGFAKPEESFIDAQKHRLQQSAEKEIAEIKHHAFERHTQLIADVEMSIRDKIKVFKQKLDLELKQKVNEMIEQDKKQTNHGFEQHNRTPRSSAVVGNSNTGSKTDDFFKNLFKHDMAKPNPVVKNDRVDKPQHTYKSPNNVCTNEFCKQHTVEHLSIDINGLYQILQNDDRNDGYGHNSSIAMLFFKDMKSATSKIFTLTANGKKILRMCEYHIDELAKLLNTKSVEWIQANSWGLSDEFVKNAVDKRKHDLDIEQIAKFVINSPETQAKIDELRYSKHNVDPISDIFKK